MSAWTFTIVDGVITGLILYALVRLRMVYGPIAARRWGRWGRRAVWAILIAAMVIIAEVDLMWLRHRLDQDQDVLSLLPYEVTYAALLLGIGLILVCGRIVRRRVSRNRNSAPASKPD
jgi:hypothetical protein